MKFKLMLLFFFLLPVTVAAPVDFNVVRYEILQDEVYVKNDLNFHLTEDIEIEIPLPKKYSDLTIKLDDETLEFAVVNNKVNISAPVGSKQLVIEYKTKDFLEKADKKFFLTEFETQLDSIFVFFELKLPEGSVLDTPINEGKSAYPDPLEISSDGQKIIIKWQKQSVQKGDKTAIFVTYRDNRENNLIFFVIPVLIIIGILGYFLAKKPKKEFQERVINKPDLHLKEDEKQIVRIIERKNGKIEQGTLVTISDFSKAKVSHVIKELEERKIIKKVKKGKKNVIMLKSKLLDLE
jgi:uncharacterized membrane protein